MKKNTVPSATKKHLPTVTVAVSAYNEEQNIAAFLASVMQQQTKRCVIEKILIISDGSSDKTAEVASAMVGPYSKDIVQGKKRLGKSLRLNDIYKSVTSDYLIQSDADVIFASPTVIEEMITYLERTPRVGLVGGNPLPVPATTFVEHAVNRTVVAYTTLRHNLRSGNNAFSADGRLLGLRKQFFKSLTIPQDMIANDRYAYYACLQAGWEYRFVPKAIVRFRSPQTLADHIRQNTRFVAAPRRMERYFPAALVAAEEYIPPRFLLLLFIREFFHYPIHMAFIVLVNRYCWIKALIQEAKLTALWDMAYTTKHVQQNPNRKARIKHVA